VTKFDNTTPRHIGVPKISEIFEKGWILHAFRTPKDSFNGRRHGGGDARHHRL
jgi:hypothetical protein